MGKSFWLQTSEYTHKWGDILCNGRCNKNSAVSNLANRPFHMSTHKWTVTLPLNWGTLASGFYEVIASSKSFSLSFWLANIFFCTWLQGWFGTLLTVLQLCFFVFLEIFFKTLPVCTRFFFWQQRRESLIFKNAHVHVDQAQNRAKMRGNIWLSRWTDTRVQMDAIIALYMLNVKTGNCLLNLS